MDQGSLVTSSKLICLLEAGWEFSPISGRFCLVLCSFQAVCKPRSQARAKDSSCKKISTLTLIFLADIKMTAKQAKGRKRVVDLILLRTLSRQSSAIAARTRKGNKTCCLRLVQCPTQLSLIHEKYQTIQQGNKTK